MSSSIVKASFSLSVIIFIETILFLILMVSNYDKLLNRKTSQIILAAVYLMGNIGNSFEDFVWLIINSTKNIDDADPSPERVDDKNALVRSVVTFLLISVLNVSIII
jgi:hypothetical protein